MRGEREERERRRAGCGEALAHAFGPEWGEAGPVWAMRGELGPRDATGPRKGKSRAGFWRWFWAGLFSIFSIFKNHSN